MHRRIRCVATGSSFLRHSLFELGHIPFIVCIITYKWHYVKKILKNNLIFLKVERGAQESTSRQFAGGMPGCRAKEGQDRRVGLWISIWCVMETRHKYRGCAWYQRWYDRVCGAFDNFIFYNSTLCTLKNREIWMRTTKLYTKRIVYTQNSTSKAITSKSYISYGGRNNSDNGSNIAALLSWFCRNLRWQLRF